MKTASIPTFLSLSDSNECTRNNGGCSIDADCINLPGSYKCVCEEGFKGDGYTCGGKFLSVVCKWKLNLSVSFFQWLHGKCRLYIRGKFLINGW